MATYKIIGKRFLRKYTADVRTPVYAAATDAARIVAELCKVPWEASPVRQAEMPPFLPDRLEAGTHNVPGAAGLLAGLRFLRKRGLESIRRQEAALIRQAAEGLSRLPEVQVYAAQGAGVQTGVLSFRLPQKDPGWVAEALSRRGIAVRAGLHCAPLAHRSAGTLPEGTVRLSFSAFNTAAQVEEFARLLGQTLR